MLAVALPLMLFMSFVFGDNVIAPEFTGDQSLTNQGYDYICDKLGGERTANGDCIETK